MSGEFCTVVDRLRRSRIVEADAAAEEGNDGISWFPCEIEHARAFEKERALLGKEEWKTSKVHLPLIDFGFCKVGVHR